MPTLNIKAARNYCEIIDQVYANRQDLKDQPLQNPDKVWFLDGNSFMREGVC